MKIDVHNHFYPEKFLKQLEKDGSSAGITVETDEWGRELLVQHGNRLVTITPPMKDINARLEDMGKAGFDMQILTLSIPSVDIFPAEVGENLARVVNDQTAEICHDHPDRRSGSGAARVDPGAAVRRCRGSSGRARSRGTRGRVSHQRSRRRLAGGA